MKKEILILLIFIFSLNFCFSQDRSIKETYKESENFFYQEEYSKSYLKFKEIITKYPDNAYYNYKFGVLCYLLSEYRINAILYFNKANENVSEKVKNSYKEIKAPVETWYYLGKINHLNYKFDTAIFYMNEYIKFSKDNEKKTKAKKTIVACQNGKKYLNDEIDINVVRIGENINSKYIDHSPLISGDMKTLIFTSRRPGTGGEIADDGLYYEDIYISYYKNNTWTAPVSISPNINTNYHEATIGLSSDGTTLFIYQSVNGGDIFVSNYDGKSWSIPESISSEINSKYKEAHATISLDKKTLYFSSNRKGGNGGMDIYKSELQGDGTWTKPENLGSGINTKYDEESPYLQLNDSTLFISSNRESSIGGFDIYSSCLQTDGDWSEPKNVGYPVNSPDDDLYYFESLDGSISIYSSNQVGTEGNLNLYSILLKDETAKNITVVHGEILSENENGSLKDLEIIVIDNVTLDTIQQYYPTENGKYTLILPTNNEYTIIYSSQGTLPQVQELNVFDNSDYRNTKGVVVLQPIILGKTGVEYDINFTKGSSNLSYSSELTLNSVTSPMMKYGELHATIQVPGNDPLRVRRQNRISEFLLGRDIDSTQFTIIEDNTLDKYSIFITDTSFINMNTRNWDIKFDENNEIEVMSEQKLRQMLFLLRNDASICVQVPVYPSNGNTQAQANSLYDYFVKNNIDTAQVIVWELPKTEKPDDEYKKNLIITDRYYGAQTLVKVTIIQDEDCRLKETKIYTIYFKFNKHETIDLGLIVSVYNDLQCESVNIVIAGYTDAIGSIEYNKKLGRQRADYIAKVLEKQGVITDKISVVSYGESDPVAPNNLNGTDNPQGRAKNRRVEIILKPNY